MQYKMLAVLLLFFVSCSQEVDGMATVTFELVRYAAVGRPRKDNGTPCDNTNQPCDPFFQICFDPNGGTDCNRVLSPIFRDVSITTFDNLQSLTFNVDTLTAYTLDMTLFDNDASNFARNTAQLMGVIMSQGNLQVGELLIPAQTTNQLHDVDFRITVRCDDGFFGSDCSVNCVPQNDPVNGHFTCDEGGNPVCRPGFDDTSTAPPCTTLADPCASNPCLNGGACSDAGSGNFVCDCAGTGFTGDTCDDNINECDIFSPCVNGGTCSDGAEPTTFTCSCPAGFSGTRCQTLVDFCATGDPCQNGATCHLGNPGQVFCACPPGFDGDLCQNDIDECSPNPCVNGGTCTQLSPPNFSCACRTGFNGPLCAGIDSPCLNSPCRNGATCTSTGPGNFNCACTLGYSGVTCEVDEDACAIYPCQNGGRCTDTLGGFICCCRQGFVGETCQDFRQEINLDSLVQRRFFFLTPRVAAAIASRCLGVEFIPNSRTAVVDSIAERNCVFTTLLFYSQQNGFDTAEGLASSNQ